MTVRLRAISASASEESSTRASWRATATTSSRESGPVPTVTVPVTEWAVAGAAFMDPSNRRTAGASAREGGQLSRMRDVLEHLSRHAEPVPAASIARDLGLPRSSVYHLLKVLHSRGYVTHYVEERRFGLGQAAYELGSAYQRQAPLARVARAAMRRIVDQCGRNAHFATLDGRDVIYLLEERAPGQPMLVTDVGVRLPAHLTASGLAMLSALPATQVR